MPKSSSEGSTRTLIVDTRSAPGPRSRGVLTVIGGLETGRVLAIPPGQEVTLGRSEGCTFRFDEASVSGTHARVVRVANVNMFVDAGSTNGSFINEQRVTEAAELKDGDRVQLGSSTVMRFSLVSEEEEEALRKMYDAALRDGLTGVFNRKHMEERLAAEIAYAIRHKTDLSVVLLDVDFFKKVNDTHGHLAGDAVLKNAAEILHRCMRSEDVLARYGGEEFVVIARGIAIGPAFVFADRIRQAISGSVATYNNTPIRVTVSAGVASLACCEGRLDRTTLLQIVDARLYRAKLGGRNRVIGPG